MDLQEGFGLIPGESEIRIARCDLYVRPAFMVPREVPGHISTWVS